MAGPEAKLWQFVKKNFNDISWTSLENSSVQGTPDLLGYNKNNHFFTVELKVTKSNRLRFSPHQISFHVRHPRNSFILAQVHDPWCLKLYEGHRILELAACGLKLEPCSLGLDACRLRLQELGACSLELLHKLEA